MSMYMNMYMSCDDAENLRRVCCAERPQRVLSIMDGLRRTLAEHEQPAPFAIHDMPTSPAMLAQLQAQLQLLVRGAAPPPAHGPRLERTLSVSYLESHVLPAVRAVHTHVEK